MMILHRANERGHDLHCKEEVWHSFGGLVGFGALEQFDEDRLGPGAHLLGLTNGGAEVITYVREGALAFADSTGRSGVIQAGEFHRLTPGEHIRHRLRNASYVDWTHVFRVCIQPSEAGLACSCEQKRFCAGDRRGQACVVASADGQRGSLHLHQDALLFSVMLEPGQHLIHELTAGRSAWLHNVEGAATVADLVLLSGDAVAVTDAPAVSLTAREPTEILLVDLVAASSPNKRSG